MRHGHGKKACSMDMHHGHAACTYSTEMQIRHAAWICSKDEKHGLDMQHEHVAQDMQQGFVQILGNIPLECLFN